MSDETGKKFRLRNLLVNRVAFVDRGANPQADIVLFKRDGQDEVVEKATKTEADGQHPASDYAYVPDPEAPSTWKLRIDDATHVAGAVAAFGPGGFRGQRVQIPAADQEAVKAKVRAAWSKFHPDKAADEMPPAIRKHEEGGSMGIDKDALDPEVREFVDGLEADLSAARSEVDAVKADLAKATEKHEEADPADDIEKSMTPEVAAIVKAEREKAEALEKRLADAEAAIVKADIEKADAEYTKRAADWKHLSLKPEEFGPVLRRVAVADAEAAAEVERVLTAANAIASEALTEYGKGGSGPTEALGKMEALAKARASEKNISEAEAMDEVLRTPDGAALYEQHRQEVK